MHICPLVTGLVPHVGGPISAQGAPTVLVGKLPAARVSDMVVCVGPPDIIVQGSKTVFIGGMPAARMGDTTAHGGVIVMGCPTVLIGDAAAGGGAGGSGAGASGAGAGGTSVAASPTAASGTLAALTPQQAQAWFDRFKADKSIPWNFPNDCCYTRAEVMAQQLKAAGVPVRKIWNYPPPGQKLIVKTSNDPSGQVRWIYHVAPTVPVRDAVGKVQDMVIDPSISEHPMTPAAWADLQQPPLQPKSTLETTDTKPYWPFGSTDPAPDAAGIKRQFDQHRADRAAKWANK